jgi:hypothetical protein
VLGFGVRPRVRDLLAMYARFIVYTLTGIRL